MKEQKGEETVIGNAKEIKSQKKKATKNKTIVSTTSYLEENG